MKGLSISKKIVALVAVACLSVVCFGLAACGGSTSSSSAASSAASASSASESASASSASASASSAAVTGVDRFVGSWQLAAIETQGITMSGDFASLSGMADTGMLTINADGTGSISIGDETANLTWAESGADGITMTAEQKTGSLDTTIPVTYENGALIMEFEQDGQSGKMIFTQDGKYAGAKDFSVADAKPITSDSQLLGTWNMIGMKMMGINIYGDADDLKAMYGDTDPSFTFNADGTFTSAGSDGTWKIDADGATVSGKDITGEYTVPVLLLDGNTLLVDMTEHMQGYEFIAVYQK